ncbi:SxtJ family membrane protein [Gammaproteobacteria bacterium]|jgi:hypothetical protein|nr:SxtJ family membrane protein [Gammaproteobacteria bacterium]MDC0466442.1 SxtJ family membrane protein [Gammaproteobacteria bacterium]
MKLPETELPSNKKFGNFFTVVFIIIASYFYFNKSLNLTFIFGVVAAVLLLVTILKDDLLLPLNRLWMRFGLLIGMIISPIVLGLIFFTFFSPVAIFMRILGRDELHLKYKKKSSYWILRDDSIHSDSFKRQF